MQRHPHWRHARATPLTMALLICGALSWISCSDSSLDPSGLRQAWKTAQEEVGSPIGTKPRPIARPRPQPRARPGHGPAKNATIPTPPYRLDARVDPADLNLIPKGAALIAAIRPDLPASLTALLAPLGHSLHRLPALQWLGQQLLTKNLAGPLGLRTDRAVIVALLVESGSFDALEKQLSAQVQQARNRGVGKRMAAALSPVRLPATALRVRLVAQVSDEKKARAGITALVTRARQKGVKGLHLTSATTTPKPLRGLAANGVVAVGFQPEWAHTWTLAGNRLLVDFLLPVSGVWSETHAAAALAKLLSNPATPARSTPPTPFERVVLLSSADLSLIIRAPALAQAARWPGVRTLLSALPTIDSAQLPRMVELGWRIANVPVDFARTAVRPFDGCGVSIYLVGGPPQLQVSWHLTAAGQRLLERPTRVVAGRDLARDNGLVEQWLKPLAARVPKMLPPTGVYAEPDMATKLFSGGLLMWPLALAELWPRLLPVKPVRKGVLKVLRNQIRPGRFVRRMNVRLRGRLLSVVLEGKLPRPTKK